MKGVEHGVKKKEWDTWHERDTVTFWETSGDEDEGWRESRSSVETKGVDYWSRLSDDRELPLPFVSW